MPSPRFAADAQEWFQVGEIEPGLHLVAERGHVSDGEAEGAVVDVTDWDAVKGGAAGLREALGPVSVVVANAGIVLSGEHIADLDPAAWQQVIEVNLTGAFLTAKASIPQLREAGGGSMILVSSVCGLTASSGYGATTPRSMA